MRITRSKRVLLAFLCGFGFMLGMWFLHILDVIHIEGASTWMAQGFMLGFILPVFIGFCFIWTKRDLSLLAILENEVELRSGVFLNRSLRIPKSSIQKVRTNWKGPNSDSRSDIIFTLSADAFSVAECSSVLNRKDDGWYFDFSNASISPSDAVELLKTSLAI
jgi:hypothetical protein